MPRIAKLTADLTANTANFEAGLKRADSTLKNSQRSWDSSIKSARQSFSSMDLSVKQIQGSLRGLAGVGLGALGVASIADAASKVIEYTDQWKSLEGRLKIVSGSMDAVHTNQEALYEISKRTRQPLADIITLYTKLNLNLTENQRKTFDTLGVTETFAKALSVTGEGSSQAASAILQFTQAVSSNFKASGAEVAALVDSAPRLAQAISRSFGDGTKSLKTLNEEGQLTSEGVINALSAMSGQAMSVADDFDQTSTTVGQSYTVMENAILKFVGTNETATSVTSDFSEKLLTVAWIFDTLGPKIDNARSSIKEFLASMDKSFFDSLDDLDRKLGRDPDALRAASRAKNGPDRLANSRSYDQPQKPREQYGPSKTGFVIAEQRREAIEAEKKAIAAAKAEKDREKAQKAAERAAISAAKSREQATSNLLNGLSQESKGLELTTSMYGQKEGAIARARKELEISNMLTREGITLTAEQKSMLEGYLSTIERQTDLQNQQEEQAKRLEEQERNRQQALDQLGSTFESAFESAIVEGEKLSDVLDSLAKDIAKLFIRRTITEPLFNGLGNIFSGINFGIGSNATGSTYVPRDMISRIHRGEMIVPKAQADMMRAGGGGGGVNVNIINNSGAKVNATSSDTGNGIELEVMIDEMVASKMGTPGSKTNQALGAFQGRALVRR